MADKIPEQVSKSVRGKYLETHKDVAWAPALDVMSRGGAMLQVLWPRGAEGDKVAEGSEELHTVGAVSISLAVRLPSVPTHTATGSISIRFRQVATFGPLTTERHSRTCSRFGFETYCGESKLYSLKEQKEQRRTAASQYGLF